MNKEQYTTSLQSLLRRRALLILIVISLACLLIWIGVSVYFSFKKTTLPPNVQKQLTPLTPVIDNKTLKELEQRKPYSPEELTGFEVVKEITDDENGVGTKRSSPTPKPSTSPASTSSAQKKVASQSAGVSQ